VTLTDILKELIFVHNYGKLNLRFRRCHNNNIIPGTGPRTNICIKYFFFPAWHSSHVFSTSQLIGFTTTICYLYTEVIYYIHLGRWVFGGRLQQYTIGFLTCRRGRTPGTRLGCELEECDKWRAEVRGGSERLFFWRL